MARCIACESLLDNGELCELDWSEYCEESSMVCDLKEYALVSEQNTNVICKSCRANLLYGRVCTGCGGVVHKEQVPVLHRMEDIVPEYMCCNCGTYNSENGSGCASVYKETSQQCVACDASNGNGKSLKNINWDDYPVNSSVVKALKDYAEKCSHTGVVICGTCSRNLKNGRVCVNCGDIVHMHQVLTLNRCTISKERFVCYSCGKDNELQSECIECGGIHVVRNMRKVCLQYRVHGIQCQFKCKEKKQTLCRRCFRKIKSTYICTCCHKKFEKENVLSFNMDSYDVRDYIVISALDERCRLKVEGFEWICKRCDMHLCGADGALPKMPRFAAARACDGPGESFQRAIRQKPEFVCTCCHRWLFHKSVIRYNAERYDFEKEIVRIALGQDVRHTMEVRIYKGEWCAHIHPEAYDVYDVDVNEMWIGDADYTKQTTKSDNMGSTGREYHTIKVEYICDTCHRYLTRKKPVMPPMACANGLQLDEVPPELQGLNDIERRVLSLRIPFMTIFCMKKFGSQKKIVGGCTNVPTKLGQIAKMLPRMSGEAEYLPMVIKRKMIYKNRYMTSEMRRDVVMVALKWLMKNNVLYKDIHENKEWFADWQESDLSDLVQDTTTTKSSGVHEPGIEDSVKLTNKQGLITGGVPADEGTGDESELGETYYDDEVNAGYDDRTEEEINEDIEATERAEHLHGAPDGTALEPSYFEDEIYTCAPAENMTPKYMLLDENFEELAFPDMFPRGRGGYNSCVKRYSKLSLRQYYQQRLLNVDGRFRKGVEYLFCGQFGADVKQLQGNTYVALRLKHGKSLDGRAVTAGMLRNTDDIKRLARQDELYKVLKTLRGSPPYWQHQMYELLAMLRLLGKPTFFMTLSAADLYWREMLECTAVHNGEHISNETIRRMSVGERSDRLKASPTTAARMFLYRVESFMESYVKHKSNPLGKVLDSVFKIEFQARGAPHAHCLLWVEDAPVIDVDPDHVVTAFIDKYISGCVPVNGDNAQLLAGMVEDFQMHKHSKTCRKNHRCRFDFPKAPSPKTLIQREHPVEHEKKKVLKSAMEILGRVREELDENDNLDIVLARAGVSRDTYMGAISLCCTGRKIVLRRTPRDTCVNNYNAGLLRYWGANVDLQYVVDENSTIMYVSSYMMKSEKEMGEVLRAVSRECAAEPIKAQLRKIGKAFLGKRVVGAPEAAMRLLSLPLIMKTRQMRYIDANMKECRTSLPKPRHILDRMDDDDEDIFQKSWHDRYVARPSELENMCYIEFCVTYDPVYGKKNIAVQQVDEEEDNCDNDGEVEEVKDGKDVIELINGNGRMRKRGKLAVPLVRQYKQEADSEAYYHARLMLYTHWRDEAELFGGCSTYSEHYAKVQNAVEAVAIKFNLHAEKIQLAWEHYEASGAPESLWDKWVPTGVKGDADGDDDGLLVDTDIRGDAEEDGSKNVCDTSEVNEKHVLSELYGRIARKDTLSPTAYRSLMRTLNKEQREIVMFNRWWCKQKIAASRQGTDIDGFKVFLSGRGGAGKSYVIQLIHTDVVKLLRGLENPESDQPLAMLTAPTGTAGFNIDGVTLHSALQLPVGNVRNVAAVRNPRCKHIASDKLKALQLLVIDEISMVGNRLFQNASTTLGLLKGRGDVDWGGASVLVVGDLMQLNPIGDLPVYRDPKPNVPGELAPLLWDDFMFHELIQIMRQRDETFVRVLNSVRIKVPDEGGEEDVILRSRVLRLKYGDDGYPCDVLHVYARNKHCAIWNDLRLDCLETPLVECYARDKSRDFNTKLVDVKFPDRPHLTGNLHKCVRLKVGARVMLTINLDSRDGLTNGAMGKVVHFSMRKGQIDLVLVEFDGKNVGVKARKGSTFSNFPNAVPVPRVEIAFALRMRDWVRVSRTQFPFMLAWAVTIHKVQGATVPSIVVDMDMKKGRFRDGQAYVAFSRVVSLEDLHIVNYEREQILVNKQAVREMQRQGKELLPKRPVSCVCRSTCEADLRLSCLNIRGLISKVDDVALCDEMGKSDVICFLETKLDGTERVTLPDLGYTHGNYTLYRNDRDKSGGGLMVIVSKRFISARVKVGLLRGFEHILVKVSHGGQDVFICCAYRSPVGNMDRWLAGVKRVLIEAEGSKLIFVGDINEDLLDKKYVGKHKTYNEMVEHGMHQHVETATVDHGALLDHLYTKNVSVDAVYVDVVDCYFSDHDIVACVLSLNGECVKRNIVKGNSTTEEVELSSETSTQCRSHRTGPSGKVDNRKVKKEKIDVKRKRCDDSASREGNKKRKVHIEATPIQQCTNEQCDDIIVCGSEAGKMLPYQPLTVQECNTICMQYALLPIGQMACVPLKHYGIGKKCVGYPGYTESMGSDGNCLFRGFSYLLSGVQYHHARIRSLICDYIEDLHNWERIKPYCFDFFSGQQYESGAAYVRGTKMRKLYEVWGTHAEIFAFTHLTGIDVEIYCTDRGEWRRHCASGNRSIMTSSAFYLINHDNVHYDVVIGF